MAAKKKTEKTETETVAKTKAPKVEAARNPDWLYTADGIRRPIKVEDILYFSEEEGFMAEDLGREDGVAAIDALRRFVCADLVDITDAELGIGVACIVKHLDRPAQRRVYDKIRTDSDLCAALKAVVALSFAEREQQPFRRAYDYLAAVCDLPAETD